MLISGLFFCCTKQVKEPKQSKEVLIDIINLCYCEIIFSDSTGRTQHEYYDCTETQVLLIQLPTGLYTVQAEGEGKKVTMTFMKTSVAERLKIVFD
jgi:hypothetical protein